MEYLPSPLLVLDRLIEPSPNILPVMAYNVDDGIDLIIGIIETEYDTITFE